MYILRGDLEIKRVTVGVIIEIITSKITCNTRKAFKQITKVEKEV